MKRLLSLLTLLATLTLARAEVPGTLAWDYPNPGNVTEFIMYDLYNPAGAGPRELGRIPITSPKTFPIVIDGLPHEYYVTAYIGTSRLESDPSNTVKSEVKPTPPIGIVIRLQ